MNIGNRPASEDPIFCATITPHRSLSRRGFIAVISAVGIVSFIGGIVFLIAGAWPVVGFFGLDLFLIYWAFRANYRAANAVEIVTVTPTQLLVRRTNHRGQQQELSFDPLWVRLERKDDPEFGTEALYLVSRARKFPVAAFLSHKERAGFADALQAALHEARRGPDRTVIH